MAASVFGSTIYGKLFDPGEAGRLFSDAAEMRAMLLVEGALAKVQGSLGIIPEISGAAIHRASLEVQLDPGGLGPATGQNGVPVPALVAAFRDAMQAPEHAQYIHWGATSQDIMDTALMLRLRQVLGLSGDALRQVLARLADMAEAGAETPCPARTYGQIATPTSWGAMLAGFGGPLLSALDALDALRGDLCVSLSGAAGTSSALGPQAAETRTALAEALGLSDPGRSWHTDRTPLLRIADWQCGVIAAGAALGQTLIGLAGHGEVSLGAAGASSTMPQKQNPVGPSALVALNTYAGAQRAALQGAAVHQFSRDGAAWFAEWMEVPQIALSCAASLQTLQAVVDGVQPEPDMMRAALDGSMAFAEALSFALTEQMPRPDAQAEVKALCRAAEAQGQSLEAVARAAHDLPQGLFDLGAMGAAPDEARGFAARVRKALA
ncbi:MAG: lyase family protein [Pseudomonadota bacterium]